MIFTKPWKLVKIFSEQVSYKYDTFEGYHTTGMHTFPIWKERDGIENCYAEIYQRGSEFKIKKIGETFDKTDLWLKAQEFIIDAQNKNS